MLRYDKRATEVAFIDDMKRFYRASDKKCYQWLSFLSYQYYNEYQESRHSVKKNTALIRLHVLQRIMAKYGYKQLYDIEVPTNILKVFRIEDLTARSNKLKQVFVGEYKND